MTNVVGDGDRVIEAVEAMDRFSKYGLLARAPLLAEQGQAGRLVEIDAPYGVLSRTGEIRIWNEIQRQVALHQ